MGYFLRSGFGFAIDHELADEFGFLDEFLIWEEEDDHVPFCEAFDEAHGVSPEALTYFEYAREGYIQELEGFEYDTTYVLFDEDLSDDIESYDCVVDYLDEYDVFLDEGNWKELG